MYYINRYIYIYREREIGREREREIDRYIDVYIYIYIYIYTYIPRITREKCERARECVDGSASLEENDDFRARVETADGGRRQGRNQSTIIIIITTIIIIIMIIIIIVINDCNEYSNNY